MSYHVLYSAIWRHGLGRHRRNEQNTTYLYTVVGIGQHTNKSIQENQNSHDVITKEEKRSDNLSHSVVTRDDENVESNLPEKGPVKVVQTDKHPA